MLGSAVDADDATQETMIRAWRGLEQFDGRASLRTWLFRIATNVCLDEIGKRGRRTRPMEEGPAAESGAPSPERLVRRPSSYWVEPIADDAVIAADADPAERVMLQQSIRLAFVAALQRLAPKQRAILLLMEVLGWPAGEVAEALETSTAAVNSALQRARATLAHRDEGQPAPLTASQEKMLDRYVAAFESYDIDGLVAMLRKDATFCMPPYELWLQGPEDVRTWMLGMGSGCRGSRLVATKACGWPAFAQYRLKPEGGYRAWALIVLELEGDAVVGVNSFLDTEVIFPRFGLTMELA